MRLQFALAWLLAFPAVAQAQWSWLPNGELGYTTTYTTSAIFTCDPQNNGLLGGTCTAFGDHLTMTSGAAILDVFYRPVTATITVSNVPQAISMGWTETILSGSGPFTFPSTSHSNGPMLFEVALSAFADVVHFGYINQVLGNTQLARNCCGYFKNTMLAAPRPAAPPPYAYGLAIDQFAFPSVPSRNALTPIVANIALIPEPTTLVLTATGLLGLAGWRRRSR